MKNFSTWMLVMFMIMFWVFRTIVAVAGEMHFSIGGFVPLNQQMEVILLFVVLVCIILVAKRKMLGGIIYLLGYGIYFGTDVVNNIQTLMTAMDVNGDMSMYMNLFASVIGLILPIAVMIDLLADKNRKNNPKDKKTDWFYTNEQFDRKLDDRADKNNYRTM